jgi:hypothetical protein
MKKLAIGILLVLAGIATVGLVTVPAMTHTVLAQGSAAAAFSGLGTASTTASASSTGNALASGGFNAQCANFAAAIGVCSQATP